MKTNIISLELAKKKFISKSVKDGSVFISWKEDGEDKKKSFPKEYHFQIGMFQNKIATQLAADNGFVVNELTRYNRKGKDINKEVKALGGISKVAELLEVKEKELVKQCEMGEKNVSLIYALSLRILTNKKNALMIKALID
tara:strand:- start:682 stop:1104 length:423 start_codon:yes stop_codon:yes gene_type:complete